MSITSPHLLPSYLRMFSTADFGRSYVLYPDVECNIPRWGSEGDYGAWNYARGVLVETSRALSGTPVSLHYRELLTRQPSEDPATVPAHLPVGREITAVVRDAVGELIVVVDHRETAPHGAHGDFWRLTVNGVVPADGLAEHPPSLPWAANQVSLAPPSAPVIPDHSGETHVTKPFPRLSSTTKDHPMNRPSEMRSTSSASESPPRLMRVALEAAAAGHYVFPLWPRSKKPSIKNWEQEATRDVAFIRERWASLPWNVGIACGPSGLLVIDLDDAHGHEPPEEWAGARHGRDVLTRLAEAADQPYPARTYAVQTPRGGQHLYFRAPQEPELRNTSGRLGWRIDTRGAGGYVVAAGSIRREGLYVALNRAAIAPLPPWLVTRLTPPPLPEPAEFVPGHNQYTVSEIDRATAYLDRVADNVARAQPGQRHDTLNRAAYTLGRLVASGDIAEHDARAALHEAAAHHVGIDDWTTAEAEQTITDGLEAGARHPRRLTDQP